MSKIKCNYCGKFRKKEDVVLQSFPVGDGYELDERFECKFCMSESDLERYGFKHEIQN